MTFLLIERPNWVVPIFRQVDNVIQMKRFPADYKWRDFIDLTAIVASIPSDLADTLTGIGEAIDTLAAGVVDAQTSAAAATVAAATAQSTADGAVSYNTTQDAAIAAAAAAAAGNTSLLPQRGHFHSEEQAVTTGTEARNTDSTYPFAGGKYTSTQNAVIEFYLTCRAGSHLVISVLGQKIASGGVITMWLDGTQVNSQDCYAAVTDKAFTWGQTLGAIAAGDHVLAFKCLTKNGSSSGYIMFINFVKWTVTP